jgi:NAD(P)-dependent dehydrogenase (short-subunit alcohol dehydrogenase family)
MACKNTELCYILITGGTSGLGLELVKLFLKKGYFVIATGRQSLVIPGFEDRFKFIKVDFSDLQQTSLTIRKICESYKFDIVINNAGVLSPPDFISTINNLEYTFQVNFLAHLLINEIIIKNKPVDLPLKICSVTSPVYKLAKAGTSIINQESDYKPFKAYSDSKFCLALMCRELSARFPGQKISCFSFDPGTFSSGIFRMQGNLFRVLYKIASPFMRKPSKVAEVLSEILIKDNISSGAIYNIRKNISYLPEMDSSVTDSFWKECYDRIGSCLV